MLLILMLILSEYGERRGLALIFVVRVFVVVSRVLLVVDDAARGRGRVRGHVRRRRGLALPTANRCEHTILVRRERNYD